MKLKTYGEFLSALEDKSWIERLEILDDAAHSPMSQGDFLRCWMRSLRYSWQNNQELVTSCDRGRR
jgi:hypothetical protein